MKRFELPPGTATGGYERGIQALAFSDEATMYSAGDGGLRRWNLEAGTQELMVASHPGFHAVSQFSRDRRLALLSEFAPGRDQGERRPARIYNTRMGVLGDLSRAFGEPSRMTRQLALDPSGRVAVTGSDDGIVRVGRLDSGAAHLLAGHKGVVDCIAISPDLRWVATTGEDSTLRLWPMPDLSKPPLHTLPLDQLLAKLHSLTNLRAVRDPASATGWKIEVGRFPGWKNAPTW